MRGVSRRERIALAVAAAVALVVGVPGILLPPSSGGKARSAAEERQKHSRIQTERAQVRAEITGLETQIQARMAAGAPQELVSGMVQATQAAARAAGLQLNDLKPLPAEKVAGIQRVPVQVSLSTRFPQMVRFLYELQNAGSRYQIDQLQLISTDPQSDQLQVELRLVSYVREEE
jgi:Tfp pilus assembly protein PilO